MKSRSLTIIWLALALAALIAGGAALPAALEHLGSGAPALSANPLTWVIPALALVLAGTLLHALRRGRAGRAGALAALRARPALYWLLTLVWLSLALGWWVASAQPTHGKPISAAEGCYGFALAWALLAWLAYGLDGAGARAMGAQLSRGRFTGVLVTLTTLFVLFWGAEAFLRRFYVTTDGYGFTAMNYWWYQNFYTPTLNSLGYRDDEPLPPDPALTRIAIVGDSFAAGHGIDDIDQTFPQRLEQMLGPGYDVNTIALSGMDSDVQTARLEGYYQGVAPRRPNVVVLSYYLNDVEYLLRDTERDPRRAFDFVNAGQQPLLASFVLNFFVPNYLYYNLLQFTSPARQTNFAAMLIDSHLDDAVWARHEPNLQAFYDWTAAEGVPLVVLLWPQLGAIDPSAPALARVGGFFAERGATVVDLSERLKAYPAGQIILNRFDAHPSVLANEITAEALLDAVRGVLGG